jgi:ABC-type uncharacterized transport system substrate-binding protein
MRVPHRWLLITLALSIGVASVGTAAQSRGKIPQVGILEPGPQQSFLGWLVAFRQALRDLGYAAGQNITVAYRFAEGQRDRLSILAAELVQLTPDVLWTHSTPATLAAKQATITIPIVLGVANALAYGARVAELCQRSAVLMDKILKGAMPADLPVERADKLYLVINLKTAAALGLALPSTFLYRADEVIQ